MELVRNEDYWGNVPKLDRLVLYQMAEAAGRLAALQSGDVDWAEVPPPDSVEQLEGEGYNVLLKAYPHANHLLPNLYRAPFDDERVRQPVAHGMYRAGFATGDAATFDLM